jgi:hypothetical protein
MLFTITRDAGGTMRLDGAMPNEHVIGAPITTCWPTARAV